MFRRLIVVLAILLALPISTEAKTHPTPAGDRVRLPGHVLPALAKAEPVKPETSRGKELLTLTLVLKRDDQAGFERYLHDVYDPKSRIYRHFLSQKELAEKFGPSRTAYDSVLQYLGKGGFQVIEDLENRLTVTVRGTRAQAERTFAIRIGDYKIGDHIFYATDRDPVLPSAIAAHTQAVIGFSDLGRASRTPSSLALYNWANNCANDPTLDPYTKKFCNDVAAKVGPFYNFMCLIYNFVVFPLYWTGNGCTTVTPPTTSTFLFDIISPAMAAQTALPGTGQKVGLVEFDSFHLSDVEDYVNLAGLPSALLSHVSEVKVNGGAAIGPNESEVLLDIDLVLLYAPGALVTIYDGPFTGGGSFQALFNQMINDGVTIISNSWAYCEDQTTLADVQSIDSVLAAAAASGISVFNASGDTGSTCLDGSPNTIGVPADSPHGTAVGGSSLTVGANSLYAGEQWWNGSAATPPTGQGGFGTSRFFGRPSYQDGFNGSAMRSIPDVVAQADPANGFMFCQADAGGCPTHLYFGGTSMAAPLWAAFTALLNEAQGHNLGLLNPLIYPLASTNGFHSAASMGSDFAHVGLGSPNLSLLNNLLKGSVTGPVDPGQSRVLVFPGEVPADGASSPQVVVQLRDAAGSTVAGKTVTLSADPPNTVTISPPSGVTNVANGAVAFTVTNLTTETVTLAATDISDGLVIQEKPTITFGVAPAASAGINAFPTTVTANGIDTTTITVTLQDALGRPTPGKLVTLAQGNGHTVITGTNPSVTDNNGQIQFAAADLVNEVVTFTAVDVSDGNLPVPGNAVVTFTNGSGGACGQNVTPPVGLNGYTVTPFATGFPVGALFFSNVNYGGCAGAATPGFLNGNVYVPDFFNGDLYKLGSGGGAVSNANKLSTLGPTLSWPVVGKDGHLYATRAGTGGNFNTGVIVELNPETGAVVRTLASNLTCPAGLAVDPLGGDLFFIDQCFGAGSDNPSLFRLRNPGSASPAVEVYATLPLTPNGQVVFSPKGTIYAVTGYTQQNPPVYRVSGTDQPTPPTVTPVAEVASNYWVNIGEVGPDGEATRLIVLNDGRLKLTDITANPPNVVGELAEGTGGGVIGPDGCLYMPNTNVLHKLTDPSGGCSFLPTNATPSITLTPTSISPNPAQGSVQTFTATIRNLDVPPDTPVFFTITGANPRIQLVRTDTSGQASLNYQGVLTGSDAIVASTEIGGTGLTSNLAQVTWDAGQHMAFLSLNPSPKAGTIGQPVSMIASLTDVSVQPPAPVAGQTVQFNLDGNDCSAVSDQNGIATCGLTPTVSGMRTLLADFAGASGFVAANTSEGFNVLTPVQVGNLPPVADAGANQTDRQGSLVTLNGGASHDPDNGPSPLSYRWTKASGPSVTLSGASTAAPTFVASAAGQYVFDLVVNDGVVDSPVSQVSITVPLLGDVDLDGDVDNDDLKLVVAARNTAANGPNDLKDINGDMKIDALDARKLTLLCTRSRCATR